jgi:hypothetical protein
MKMNVILYYQWFNRICEPSSIHVIVSSYKRTVDGRTQGAKIALSFEYFGEFYQPEIF